MTITDHKSSLHSRLAQAYPNQMNGLVSGSIYIRVDDRDSDDICYSFCDIHLRMSDLRDDNFTLILENVPFDDEVKSIASELNGTWQTTRSGERLTLNFTSTELREITRLSKAIRQLVGRGKSYLDRNWKWIVPRTSKSLERLARVLGTSRTR